MMGGEREDFGWVTDVYIMEQGGQWPGFTDHILLFFSLFVSILSISNFDEKITMWNSPRDSQGDPPQIPVTPLLFPSSHFPELRATIGTISSPHKSSTFNFLIDRKFPGETSWIGHGVRELPLQDGPMSKRKSVL